MNLTGGKLSFGVSNNQAINIEADDWNSIGPNTVVPACVPISIDPTFDASNQTSVNRFQYLADRMIYYPTGDQVGSYLITFKTNGNNLGLLIAFRNSTSSLQELSDLRVSIKASPPETVVVSSQIPDSSVPLLVPPHAIYFREFYVSQFQLPPDSATNRSVSIDVSNNAVAFQ